MARRILSRTVVVIAVAVGVVGCLGSSAPPGPARMAAEAARLEQILPVLEELQVTGFTVEDGCTWLVYGRGRFFDGGDSCQPGGAGPFDDVARADHARLAGAIAAAGAPTGRILDATLGPDGRLRTAVFRHSAHPFPDQWEYVYDPGNVEPKVEGGRLEVEYTRIDDEWWFRSALDD